MKLYLPCLQCKLDGLNDTFVQMEFDESNTYKVECDNGHKNIIIVEQEHFEILYELGAMALLDSYTREAVSSFATSVERFHEYCIKVILNAMGVDEKTCTDTWKYVSRYSERQLGAFYFLYLSYFKRTPKNFHQTWSEFRNKVIHNGYIPKHDEARNYAKHVYDYIIETISELKETCESSMRKVATRKNIPKTELAGYKPSFWSLPTMIDLQMGKVISPNSIFSNITFDEALERLKIKMETWYRK